MKSRFRKLIADPSHPAYMFFELLPSGKQYSSLVYGGMSSRTNNSLYPTAVRVLNDAGPSMEIIVLWNRMLQLDSTTVSAARMRIKFHCISCLYAYINKIIVSYLCIISPRHITKKNYIIHACINRWWFSHHHVSQRYTHV